MTAFLEAAVQIGRAICRSAYWDRDQVCCNWVGRSPVESPPTGELLTPTVAALGPELYSGTSGVALFLAQLFARTGNLEFRHTALGAITRALRQLDRSPRETAQIPIMSFYSGHLGVAYVTHRVALLTAEERLTDPIEAVLDDVARARAKPHALDLIGGNAGAIPALLALDRVAAWRGCRDLAVALGEDLCQAATRHGDGVAWNPEDANGPGAGSIPLTGFGHGAAGIGLALLELYSATSRPGFLEIGRRAFVYEDSVFNQEQGNWPDFRPYPGELGRPGSLSYALAWCHGAPGIALSRLRAISLDVVRREPLVAVARVGLQTMLGAIERRSRLSRQDATLCHGLAGLNEVLWTAGTLLNEETYQNFARAIALSLIKSYGEADDWPTGVPSGGPNPSLMLGTAGIGYHFLRLDSPKHVPPILALEPMFAE
jgi:lantibiotic modifying enzyme